MISPVSNAHTSNTEQATQPPATKALPQVQAQKSALPEDAVTLKSAAKTGGNEENKG
jgi:hypothetical protein